MGYIENHENNESEMNKFRSAYAYAIRKRRPTTKREMFMAYWRKNYPAIDNMIPSDEMIDSLILSHASISDAVKSIADDIFEKSIDDFEIGDHNGRR
jgi:hypothetical protein